MNYSEVIHNRFWPQKQGPALFRGRGLKAECWNYKTFACEPQILTLNYRRN
jgi:hypothetical protein